MSDMSGLKMFLEVVLPAGNNINNSPDNIMVWVRLIE